MQTIGPFADLRGADLQCRDLGGANLWGAYLQGANLRGANLQGAKLSCADLHGAYLQGANLQGAKLWRAGLQRADLHGANLQGAKLWRADLRRADLQGAKLRDADLRGAKLRDADLRDADLTDTALDPRRWPNGEHEGFEIMRDDTGTWVRGYRTVTSPYMGGNGYHPGELYEAPVFSTCDTECHPGLYLCPTPSVGHAGRVIEVYTRPWLVHKAGAKYRCPWFITGDIVGGE